ncbi:MAG: SDR family oxidoreductase [Novosphingobium sp.]|nr:SDR family oxidoreductase [Novosphingobium sp.]
MMGKLDGKTALVTGASRGIGKAVAMLLASEGAKVAINFAHNESKAKEAADEIIKLGGKAILVQADIGKASEARAMVERVANEFSHLDILVNNAGISVAAQFMEMTSRDTQRHIDINLMGTVWMCRAVWPHMQARQYGRIVNTGSGAFAGMWAFAIYGASKGDIFSLTRGLAAEGKDCGIKVNSVNPGAFSRMLLAQQPETSPMYQHAQENLPAEQVSPAVAYLAHESCPVTGECFDVMGGNVQRTYLAQTSGFTDPNLSIETVAERWDEVMGDPQDPVIGLGSVDTELWHIKPYTRGKTETG